MENEAQYYQGLRKIISKNETCRSYFMPLLLMLFVFGALGIVFPPILALETATLWFFLFLMYRTCFSRCPRCNGFYWGIPIFGYIPGIFGHSHTSRCAKCGLRLSILPEIIEPEKDKNGGWGG
jgi:hypothetical protein